MSRRLILAGLVLLVLGLAPLASAQVDVNHPKVCSQGATPSTTDIDCPDWNADHVLTGGAQGRLLYRDTGEANGANWAAEAVYDETGPNFTLFGGTVGTNGVNVLSLGCTSTDPTTSPNASFQMWCKNLGGANTGGLVFQDEAGTRFQFGPAAAASFQIIESAATYFLGGGGFGTLSNDPIDIFTNNTFRVRIDELGNVGLGTGTFGANAEGTFAIAIGTEPSTSPADLAQITTVDLAGAGTATMVHRDESGNVTPLGHLTATTTYDAPSIAAGAETNTTVTVTGAAVGNPALCGLTTLTTQDLHMTAAVSASNTVRVLLGNPTAGAIDLASGTLRCSVWRY